MNLTQHNDELQQLCQQHQMRSLAAFGSVLRQDFTQSSDIDLIVDIDDVAPLSYADKYFALKFALEQLFRRSIELLEEKELRNPCLRQRINATKVLLYG